MTRFLFISGTPASVRQGSGTYVGISVLREALIARGHQITLIAPEKGFAGAASRIWFNYRVRKAALREKPDVLVGFDLDGVFAQTGGALDVASIKGVIAEELQFEEGAVRASLLLQSRLEKRRVRRAQLILTTSHYAAERIQFHYGVPAGKVCIVPEPIDLEEWFGALAAAPAEKKREPAILCVAHLYPRKDVATLLRAMERLTTAATLRIIGSGPELARLKRITRERKLEKRVQFLEHVPYERLVSEYRNADIFCFPSRQEGFGIVLLEAMAAGLPVIASRAAAIPEVVPEGKCGLLIEPGDDAAFAAAIERLIQDEELRRQFGEAGRKHVMRYDARLVAAQFLSAVRVI